MTATPSPKLEIFPPNVAPSRSGKEPVSSAGPSGRSCTEVTADPYQISATITGEVSDEPPHVLVSLAMLELQANRKERAAHLVDEIYAAFDQADMKIKTGTIERTDASSCRPAGRSSMLSQSSLHHAADAGD